MGQCLYDQLVQIQYENYSVVFLSLSKEPETFPYRVADGDFNAELELCERGLVRGLIRGDLARMEPPASAACRDYESSECAHVSNKVAEAALLSTPRGTLMGCTPTPPSWGVSWCTPAVSSSSPKNKPEVDWEEG